MEMSYTPTLKLETEILPAQNFKWALTPGMHPYYTSVIVPNAISARISELHNPASISLTCYGGVAGIEKKDLKIQNVYIVESKVVNDYEVSWLLADARWIYRGRKIYCSYNKTRTVNIQATGSPVINSLDPYSLRSLVDLYKVGRYIPWSVQADGTPWSMMEIIEKVCEQADIELFFLDDTASKGTYYLENIEFNGEDAATVIEKLCERSRLRIGISRTGTLFCYSYDFFDQEQENYLSSIVQNSKTSTNKLYRQDLKRIRPKNVHVFFEQKKETWVVQSTSSAMFDLYEPLPLTASTPGIGKITGDDIQKRRVIGCENVIRVPYPLLSNFLKRNFQVGEYVPFWHFLSAIGLTDAEVRTLWFGSKMELRLSVIMAALTGSSDIQANMSLASNICGAIRSHYRQVYRLDPYHVDRIESWEAKRVAIIDSYSHFSPPSPVYADYCVCPKLRHPSIAKALTVWQEVASNWIVDIADPNRERPTAGTITMVDQKLGIFRITYPQDLTDVVKEIIPSAVDNIPYVELDFNRYWQTASLTEAFTMETIVAVQWSVSTSDVYDGVNKYWIVSFDMAGEGGTGPDIEYLSNTEFARIPLSLGADPEEKPLNEGLVNSIAQIETVKIMNSYKDRIVGTVTFSGFGPRDFMLAGNMKEIRYSFTPSRGLETVVDLEDIPKAPEAEAQMTQQQINYLHKHIARGDERNEI